MSTHDTIELFAGYTQRFPPFKTVWPLQIVRPEIILAGSIKREAYYLCTSEDRGMPIYMKPEDFASYYKTHDAPAWQFDWNTIRTYPNLFKPRANFYNQPIVVRGITLYRADPRWASFGSYEILADFQWIRDFGMPYDEPYGLVRELPEHMKMQILS